MSWFGGLRYSVVVGGCLLSFVHSTAVMAADAADHFNVQRPGSAPFVPGGADAVFSLPPVAGDGTPLPALGGDAPSVLINRIVFRGAAAIPADALQAVVAPYVGRRLSEADLEMLRIDVTRHYIDRGFVNSGALIGEHALSGDTLILDIVEGHLGGVRLRGMDGLRDAYLVDRLLPEADEVLNLDRLRERFLLALEDPLFRRLNARIVPGDQSGEAILDVDVERARTYGATLFANNYRPPSIGENAFGVSGWLRNVSGYGDTLEMSVQGGSGGADDRRGALGWRVPFAAGRSQFSLQLEQGRSSVIEEPLETLDIRSTLRSVDAGLRHAFVETLNHRLSAGVQRVWRENRTTLAGLPFSFVPGEPDGVTRVSAWRFWQEYAYRSETQAFVLRSTLTRARNNRTLMTGLPVVPTDLADRHYQVWLGQAHYARQLSENGIQGIVRASLQRTSHRLLPLDRMAIGGVYTVRGYRENQLVRDEGDVVNVELSIPVIRKDGVELTLSPFVDWGRAWNQGERAERLSSAGLAARFSWQGLKIECVLARRLQHPDSVSSQGGTLQDRAIHVQVSYDAF